MKLPQLPPPGQVQRVLSLVLLIFLSAAAASGTSQKRGYIVTLRNLPSVTEYLRASYATEGAVRQNRIGFSNRLHSVAARRHSLEIEQQHMQTLSEAGVSQSRKFYSYKYASSAFAAALTKEEVIRLQANSKVGMVQPVRTYRALTTHTPQFLQLPTTMWKATNGVGSAGENVIIGVIDTGVWPESKSFANTNYGPVPSKWNGTCNTTKDFKSCNRKLIGANYFYQGFVAHQGSLDMTVNYLSPRDTDGHGTHTSGTAGGNNGVSAVARGQFFGLASGMAPRARLAVYKALWSYYDTSMNTYTSSGTDADIIAAIDQCVSDGVDVISFSVEASGDFFGPTDLAFLVAAQAGVVASVSAGNNGLPVPVSSPDLYGTVAAVSPWYISVAASTHDRKYNVNVTLGSGAVFSGVSMTGSNSSSSTLKPVPFIDASAAGYEGQNAILCDAGKLDPAKVRGTVVLCLRGVIGRVAKGQNVLNAGGLGMVLRNDVANGDAVVGDFHYLPAAHVTYTTGLALLKYVTTASRPTVVISKVFATYGSEAPIVSDFSSAGPSFDPSDTTGRNSVLKPDVTAPGVDILAPYSLFVTPNSTFLLPFNSLSGTSMAAPHVSGLAAILRQLYPNLNKCLV